jgi:hypothetical protein
MVLRAAVAASAPRTVVVGIGDCQSVELVTVLNDFSVALRERLKSDLYEPDVVLDIVRPRPTRSLEDVERQVESARTLFYNGQHSRSLDLIKQALAELERAPIVGQPWKVTAQALALQGVVLTTLNKKAEAAESFRRVLRVEPAHALSSDEFTPSVISQFESFRKEFARQKKAVTHVQSTPPGAEVLIDGRLVGVTPLSLELAPSTYRLVVRVAERVSYLRVITAPRDAQIQIDLSLEGALATQTPLCLSAKDKTAELAALRLANTVTADDLITVRLEGPKGTPGQFVAARYEIRSGSIGREGRVQVPVRGTPAFGALAAFLFTGQSSSFIVSQGGSAALESQPSDVPVVSPKVAESQAAIAPSAGGISAARVVSFVLLGAGAAGIAAGIIAWAGGASDRTLVSTLRQGTGKLPDPFEPGHRQALDAIGRSDANQTLAFSLLGAGAGLAAAGLISLFVFPGETLAVTASPSSDGVSVFVSAGF